jgi:hypothetical protein
MDQPDVVAARWADVRSRHATTACGLSSIGRVVHPPVASKDTGGLAKLRWGPDRGAVGSCSGISPTTEARYISRACDPTAGLLNRGTKSSLDWEEGDTVHLGPCQAHRGEATASRGFCSRARGGVFAEVELTPALDEEDSS